MTMTIIQQQHKQKQRQTAAPTRSSHGYEMVTEEDNEQHHDEPTSAVLVSQQQQQQQVAPSSMTDVVVISTDPIRAKQVQRKMRFLTAMAAIGGFLFGYDTGVISGAMLPIQRAFDLNAWQEEVVVSSTVLAAFASSLMGGSLNTHLGRRKSILIAACVFSIGSMGLSIAWDYPSLVVGRVIVGIGIGIASLTTPIYLAEVAVPEMRGQLVTVNALLVTLGQFIAGMVDGIFDEIMPTSGWRFMLGLAAVPSLIMLWGFWFHLPESPRWLAINGHVEEARSVLESIRATDDEAHIELTEIVNALPPVESSSHTNGDDHHDDVVLHVPGGQDDVPDTHQLPTQGQSYDTTTSDPEMLRRKASIIGHEDESEHNFLQRVVTMVSDRPTRRALTLGCGIMLLQQMAGINTVMVRTLCLCFVSLRGTKREIWSTLR